MMQNLVANFALVQKINQSRRYSHGFDNNLRIQQRHLPSPLINALTRLIDFLDQSKVRYEILHHPEAFTSHELAAIEHVKGKDRAKVVMVKAGAEILMAVLPTDRRIDLEKISAITARPTTKA